ASESFNFGVDLLHADFKNVTSLIVRLANQTISKSRKRRALIFEARRHFLSRAVMVIIAYRKRGAKLAQVLPLVWNWRWELLSLHRPRITYGLLRSLLAPNAS